MTRRLFDLHARQRVLHLGRETKIMGIVNCTPDSFSQDGLWTGPISKRSEALYRYALRLVKQGAQIVDVGGESTRPGAAKVSEGEELRRVIPLVRKLARQGLVVSVDTSKPEVAIQALQEGASLINYVRGTKPAQSILKAVRDHQAAIVLMHSRGTPKTMQRHACYRDLFKEIQHELGNSVENCLEIGIKKDKIVLDPGIGFAKTLEQNLALIDQLERLGKMGFPILLGASRKSLIGKVLGQEIGGRLMGTAACVAAGIMRGAHIVRVHDVAAMRDVAAMTDAILNHHA